MCGSQDTEGLGVWRDRVIPASLPDRRAPPSGSLPAGPLRRRLADNVDGNPQLQPLPTTFTYVAIAPCIPPVSLLTCRHFLKLYSKKPSLFKKETILLLQMEKLVSFAKERRSS